MTAGLATYADLASVLSLEDLYRLLEIAAVNAHNEGRYARAAERKRGQS